jgi:hypothetical protein
MISILAVGCSTFSEEELSIQNKGFPDLVTSSKAAWRKSKVWEPHQNIARIIKKRENISGPH